MTNETVPEGVSAIFVVEGRVIAHVTDFARDRPGGFTVREAQELRARRRLAHAVVKELSSSLLYEHVDEYVCKQILQKIPGKVHVLPITAQRTGAEQQ